MRIFGFSLSFILFVLALIYIVRKWGNKIPGVSSI